MTVDNWNLGKLKADATEACRAAWQKREEARGAGAADPFPHDAINWGDLKCIEAQSVRSSEMEPHGLRVIIEEASPDCDRFRQFIAEELERKGWPCLEVSTEW